MHTIPENYIQKSKEKTMNRAAFHIKKEGLEESALGMLSKNFDSNLISEITKLPMTKIQALKQGMKK